MTNSPKNLVMLLIASLWIFLVNTAHAKPKLDLTLSLSEQYTDNVNQVKLPETDSFITEINPGISLSDKGAKTDYALSYNYRLLEYSADDQERRKEHNLNSSVNRYEFDRLLKLNASAQITNTNSSTSDTNLGDGLTGKNRQQTLTLSSGFELTSGLRQWHQSSMTGKFQHTETKNNEVDVDLFDASFSTKQGRRQKNVSWTARGTLQKDSDENENSLGFARLGYRFYKYFSLFGQHQYEQNVAASDLSIINSSWGAGIEATGKKGQIAIAHNKVEKGSGNDFISVDFSWNPTTRTSLSGGFTERFFGESYRLSLQHNTRKLRNELSYTDAITTFARESITSDFGFLICPQGQFDPAQCFVPVSLNQPIEPGFELVGLNQQTLNILEDQILNRTLTYTSAYSFSKTTVTASVFWNRTKLLTDENIPLKDYDEELGGSLGFLWKAGAKTNVSLNGSYRDVIGNKDTPIESSAEEYSIRSSISRSFSNKITGSLTYTYLNRQSDNDPLDGFIENRIALSALVNF